MSILGCIDLDSKWLLHLDLLTDYPVIKCINTYYYQLVIHWLVALGEKPEYGRVDIHVKNENALKKCCIYGNLAMSKWLIELGSNPAYGLVDIHANNNEIFNACYHNYMTSYYSPERNNSVMVHWLVELSRQPSYHPILKLPQISAHYIPTIDSQDEEETDSD